MGVIIDIRFITIHASFKKTNILIIETYANILKPTCKLASAASLRIFCYSNRIKILLGQDSDFLAIYHINAGILLQNCQKVRLNFVSLVFPPVIFYYQKMKRKYRSFVLNSLFLDFKRDK